MDVPEKLHWNMIFLVLSGKIIFLFPKNIILHLRRKMKDDLSQKKYTEIYFLQTFWKDGLFKKGHTGTWSFLYYLERWFFFSRKHDIFSLGRKWEMNFLKKYMEVWYFLCTRMGVTNVVSSPSAKRHQRWCYPAKIQLKVIGVLDWHPRKSSSNSLYFHGDLSCIVRAFLCTALQQKKTKNRKLNI